MDKLEKYREKFLKSYPDVPESLRSEIIAIVEGKTYSWNTAYFEIKNNTPLGKEILKRLIDTNII